MNCPDLGTLRGALDEPGTLREQPLAEHLAGCAACRSTLADLRRTAELAGPALALLEPPETPTADHVAAALRHGGGQPAPGPATGGPAPDMIENGPGAGPLERPEPRDRTRRWRRLPAGLRAAAVVAVVAVALGAVAATPTGRGAAADLLAQFRSERLEVVTFDPNDPGLRQGLRALQSVGTVNEDAFTPVQPQRVASLAEASRRVGFDVQGVEPSALPAGARAEPMIYVVPERKRTVVFTFDREKARRFVAEEGHPDVRLPAKFDGASLIVDVPAAALFAYPGPDDVPKVVAGQAGRLDVSTRGDVNLAEMRDFLLGLPGLPEETVQQLRAISDWRTTLPVFVPAGKVDWERTTVDGRNALAFSGRGGVVSAVVWQQGGRIYGVGGPIGEADARRAAAGFG